MATSVRRVCNELGDFHSWAEARPEAVWPDYCRYRDAVRSVRINRQRRKTPAAHPQTPFEKQRKLRRREFDLPGSHQTPQRRKPPLLETFLA